MSLSRPLWNFAFLSSLAFGMDMATKAQARSLLSVNEALPLVEGRVWAMLAYNPHGVLSYGASWSPAFLKGLFIVATLVSFLITFRMLRAPEFQSSIGRAGLALVFGGAAGNFVERIGTSRGVTDFLAVGWGAPAGGIFNFADLFLVFGCAMVLASFVMARRNGVGGQPARTPVHRRAPMRAQR